MPNQHHAEYAPSILRAPSPASSIGTSYAEDQTSLSDVELDQASFEKKWEERLQLRLPTDEEEQVNASPLLPRPPPGSTEEKELFHHVLDSLRDTIDQLEEDELFEQMVLRGSRIGLEHQPTTTTNIDALMRSMMIVPGATPAIPTVEVPQPRPEPAPHLNGASKEVKTQKPAQMRGMVPGKRSRNGTRRN